MRKVFAGVILGFLAFTGVCNAGRIDLGSLLEEMVDRCKIAEFPAPEFLCKQAGSYNRRAKTPGNSDWFANDDSSYFYGSEKIDGREEWIMMDVEGPGVIAAKVVSSGIAKKKKHFSPPMGWNSYTGYSIAATAEELKKNIDVLAEKLLPYGYDTVTVVQMILLGVFGPNSDKNRI